MRRWPGFEDDRPRAAGLTRGVGCHCAGYSSSTLIHTTNSTLSTTGANGGARARRQRIRSRAINAYESLAQCHLSDWEDYDA